MNRESQCASAATSPQRGVELARILDTASPVVVATDLGNTYTFVNAAAADYHKVRPSDMIGRRIRDFFPVDLATRMERENEAVICHGAPREFEDTIGGRKKLRLKAPLRNESGEIIGIVGVITDVTELREAQVRLLETEAQFRAIFDNASDGILLMDLVTRRFGSCNSACCRMLGYSEVDLCHMTMDDLFEESDRPWVGRVFEEYRAGARTHIPDLPMKRRDGSIVHVSLTSSAPIVVSGREYLAGFFRDVGERLRTEQALRESEERYRSVVTSMAEGVILQAADGRIIAHNERAEKILGLSRDQLLGHTSADLDRVTLRSDGSNYPDEEHPTRITLRTGQPCRQQVMGVKFAGSATRWISINTEPLFEGDAKQPHAVIATFVDITENVECTQRSKANEHRLSRALEAGDFGVYEYDFSTQLAICSPKHRQIFGYSSSDPLWTHAKFLDHVLAEDLPEVLRKSDLSKPAMMANDFECRIRRADGAIRWVRVWREVEYANDGRPRFLRGLIKDVTGRKEAEAAKSRHEHALHKAMQFESLVGVSGGIAHDVNNILCSVATAAEVIAETDPSSREFQDCVQIIRQSVTRAKSLTDLMLAHAGKLFAQTEEIVLSSYIEGHKADLQALAGDRIGLRWNLSDGLPAIRADRAQLLLVLSNLIANGVEACPPNGGSVTVSTGLRPKFTPGNLEASHLPDCPLGDYLYLRVRDTGAGIPPDIRGRIFEPFFSTKFIGRGMGLAAVAGIARAMRGGIEVESISGSGTTFTLYFPLPRSETIDFKAPAIPISKIQATCTKRTILVADDDVHMRKSVALALELDGYAVVEAADGQQAVELFTATPEKFGAVVLDLTMPRMGGDCAFAEMLRLRPQVRVVIISGYAEDQVTARLGDKQPTAILTKPFQLEALFEAVSRCCTT